MLMRVHGHSGKNESIGAIVEMLTSRSAGLPTEACFLAECVGISSSNWKSHYFAFLFTSKVGSVCAHSGNRRGFRNCANSE